MKKNPFNKQKVRNFPKILRCWEDREYRLYNMCVDCPMIGSGSENKNGVCEKIQHDITLKAGTQ